MYMKKLIFNVFVIKTVKSHFARFCILLQTPRAAEKVQRFIPTVSRFWRRRYFIFVIYFGADKIHLTDKGSLHIMACRYQWAISMIFF